MARQSQPRAEVDQNEMPDNEEEMMKMLYQRYGIEDDEDEDMMGEIIDEDDPINQAEFQKFMQRAAQSKR